MTSVAFLTAPTPIGVDHWRVHGPAYHLAKQGHDVKVVPLGQDMVAADVLVASQRASARLGAYAHIRERLCRPHRMLLVVDCCDDPETREGFVGEVRHGRANEDGTSVAELAQDALRSADLVTVNSEAMAAVCRRYNPNVAVIPDLIDGERWVPPHYERPESVLARRTFVGVAGGQSHEADWRILAEVWPRVAASHPGVGFVCIGHTPGYLAEAMPHGRLVSIPFQPFDVYQRAYIGLDVGCAPLDPSLAFNRSKSPIKWFEYSLAGAATVASPTVYGEVIAHGKTGLIATTADEWYLAIVALLDRTTRWRMVARAREAVIERHTLTPARLAERLAIYAEHHGRVYDHSAAA